MHCHINYEIRRLVSKTPRRDGPGFFYIFVKNSIIMITARHFKESEFKACTPSCSMQDMNQGTITRLDMVRDLAGIPLVLNSAYRSKEWEKKQGRTGKSAHCEGRAADIRCNSSQNRWKIVKAAIQAGFTRIGIGKTYIHLDDSYTHESEVIWHYYK